MERTWMYNERGNARRRALKRVRELIENEQNKERMRDTNSELDNDSEEYDTQISEEENDQGFDVEDLEVHAEAFCTSSERQSPRRTNSERHATRRTSIERQSPRGTSSERQSPRGTSSERQSPRRTRSERQAPSRTRSERQAPRHTRSERQAPRRTGSERQSPRGTSSERQSPRGTSSERHAPRRTGSETQQTSSLQTSLLCNILANQEIIMEQMRIVFKTLQGMQATDEAEMSLDPNLLPLTDVGSLQSLEEQLQSSPELYKQLVNTLALKGGVDLRECVWRIMHAVFTNPLARNINMRGINGKTGFQRLQLRDVVIAAVRCNRHTSGATDQEIDSTIKRWLHLAPDRDGGRMERLKRKLDSATS